MSLFILFLAFVDRHFTAAIPSSMYLLPRTVDPCLSHLLPQKKCNEL